MASDSPTLVRDQVDAWRIEVLVAAGYPFDDAVLLAADLTVDLHLAVELVHRGCPLTTALLILL